MTAKCQGEGMNIIQSNIFFSYADILVEGCIQANKQIKGHKIMSGIDTTTIRKNQNV